MNKRILVTGATGGVGSQLVQILKEKRADFIAGVRSLEKSSENMDRVLFDYADVQSIRNAMADIHSLFLLPPFIPDMQKGQLRALKVAIETGVKHIVRLSMALADPRSDILVARIHGEVDKAVKESGIDYTILEPATFMQNFTTFQRQSIKEQNAFHLPVGNGKTGFIHTRDVAAVAAEVLLNPEEHYEKTYYLTGSEGLSYGDAAVKISEATSKEVSYIDLPDDMMVKALQDLYIPKVLIDQMMSLYKAIKKGELVKYSTIVSTAVRDITGRDPITFSEFAYENAALWQ